ncbi:MULTISPECIES: hypothetical protein [unclassified Corynebacterium]|nr:MULTISPECIES: hypothetical protein [unclassified Corynebacterium]
MGITEILLIALTLLLFIAVLYGLYWMATKLNSVEKKLDENLSRR